jgi:hypothetical protein
VPERRSAYTWRIEESVLCVHCLTSVSRSTGFEFAYGVYTSMMHSNPYDSFDSKEIGTSSKDETFFFPLEFLEIMKWR